MPGARGVRRGEPARWMATGTPPAASTSAGPTAPGGDDGLVAGAVEDRRLQPHPAGAAVEDDVQPVDQHGGELLEHVRGGCRAHPAEAVGRRCGEPAAEPCQHGLGHGMVGRPDPHGVLAAGDVVTRPRAAGDDEGQRPRPERGGEPQRVSGRRTHPAVEVTGAGHMHDERVVRGAALGGVHAGDGGSRLGVGREPVDRLGRQADEATAAQRLDGAPDIPRRAGEGGHASSLTHPPLAISAWVRGRSCP